MPPKAKPQSHICAVCVKYVLDGEDGIVCDADCKRWFHPDCVKLDREDFKKLSADRKRKWFCNRTDCDDNDYSKNDKNPIASLSTQMASIMDILSNLATKDEIAAVTSGINDIKTELHKLSNKIDELEPRLKTVEERLDEMEREVKGVTQCSNTVMPENIIGEINDRSMRARNVMVYNIAESRSTNLDSRIAYDRELVRKLIVAFVPNLEHQEMRVLRVGKQKHGSARPLKIVFKDDQDARQFLMSFSGDAAKDIDPSDMIV